MSVQSIWQTINLGNLLSDEVIATLGTSQGVIDLLGPVIDTVATILDLLLVVTIADLDLVKAAIAALILALDAVIDFFIATSVGVTYLVPTSYRSAPTVQTLLNRVAESFDDKTDANRPIGQSEEDFFLMWVAIGAGPSVKELFEAFQKLMELFGKPLPDLGTGTSLSFYDKALGTPPRYPPFVVGGQGQAPTWESYRLADLQPFSIVVNALFTIRGVLAKGSDNVEQLQQRISLIRQRLAAVEAQIQRVLDLAITLLEATQAVSGLRLLALYGQGSIATQQQKLREATALPSYPFETTAQKENSACFVLHFQAGTGTALEAIMSLLAVDDAFDKFGQEKILDPIEQASEQISANTTATKSAAKSATEPWDNF